MSGNGRQLLEKVPQHRSDRRKRRWTKSGKNESYNRCGLCGAAAFLLVICMEAIMRVAVKTPSIGRLIVVPAVISIAVTALRLVGELLHWPKPLVNSDVCGKAILGVVWLVPIFGIYFAVRLFYAGDTPERFGRSLLLAILGLALKLAGTFLMESHAMTYALRLSMNFIITLIALVLCAMAWRTLCKVLLAYGYLSRIPVAIVQYLAMRGHWGTHYDALDPGFPPIGFWPIFLRVSFVPNVFFMEAYTAVVGALVGIATAALLGRIRRAPLEIGA